uniref:Uncharacterized protein n=1 Tax=Rhizophora mucronata TaxID=61149 RepID=A0A2P2MZ35_RHIMU
MHAERLTVLSFLFYDAFVPLVSLAYLCL